MTDRLSAVERRALGRDPDRHELTRRARHAAKATVLFDSAAPDGWQHGPLLALDPRRVEFTGESDRSRDDLLGDVDTLVARRARADASASGVVLAMPFDTGVGDPTCAALAAWEVDAAVVWGVDGPPELVVHAETRSAARQRADDWERRLARSVATVAALRTTTAASTSLPHARYIEAVEWVRAMIAAGEIYQANLCQRLEASAVGDPYELYCELVDSAGGPRSAYLEWDGAALVSVSPESFVSGSWGGTIQTRPIKGTSRRGDDLDDDRRRLEELVMSEKDHAELLMIVDLERNDLSRLCEAGSVRVAELAAPRSFATVHHLEARIEGRLHPDAGPRALIGATFPGGSISGAPKRRALEVLAELEPAQRGFFTGSLFWFGDDGRFDSSILIRTLEVARGRIAIGAGGGVTWNSRPDAEWREANDKARALARAVGFEPEDAR